MEGYTAVSVFVKKLAALSVLMVALLVCVGAAYAGPLYDKAIELFEKGEYKNAADGFVQVLAVQPENSDAAINLAECYYNLYSEKNPRYSEKAASAYKRAIELAPDEIFLRLKMARALLWSQNIEEAVRQLKYVLKIESSSTAAMIALADIYSWDEKTFDQAEKYALMALKIDPNSTQALLTIARINAWKGNHAKAISTLETVLELEPENDGARLEYANELIAAGRSEDAVFQFKYLSGKKGAARETLIGLAEAYFKMGRIKQAEDLLDGILKDDPENGKALKTKGMILVQSGENGQAVQVFKKAVTLDPDSKELKLYLARVLAMEKETFGQAVSTYEQVVQRWPDDIEGRTELARFYSFNNQHENAVEQFEYLIGKYPENARIQSGAVRIYLNGNMYEKAVDACKNLVKLRPESLKYKLMLGDVYLEGEQFGKAIDAYEDVLDHQPDNLQGMVALGWVRHKLSVSHAQVSAQLREKIKGQWIGFFSRISLAWHNFRASWHSSRAIAILTEAALKHPYAALPHIRIAEIHAQNNEMDLAEESYRTAIAKDPGAVQAYLGLAWVLGMSGQHEQAVQAIGQATRMEPSMAQALKGLGTPYALQQDIRRSIEDLQKQLVSNYTDVALHKKLADLYYLQQDYHTKAISECMYVLENDPTLEKYRLMLARLYVKTGQHDQALPVFDQLLQGDSSDRALYLEMMKAKAKTNGAKAMVKQLSKELEDDPYDVEARIALAQAHFENGELKKAEREFKIVLKADKDSPQAHLGLGDIYRITERQDLAEEAYMKVLSEAPDTADAYYGLGVISRLKGRSDRAVAMQTKALELDPGNADALTELSYGHYMLLQTEGAGGSLPKPVAPVTTASLADPILGQSSDVAEIEESIKEDPNNCDLRFAAAKKLKGQGKNPQAIDHLRKLLEKCPDHVAARVALSDIFSDNPSTYSFAISQVKQVLEREPGNYEAHYKLARLYSWSMQFASAANQYRWCIKARPDLMDLRMDLAATLASARRYNEAIAEYKTILKLDPNRADVRMELAALYGKVNDVDQAVKQYEKILDSDPNNFEARLSLARMYKWDRRYYDRAVELYRQLLVHYPSQVDIRKEFGKLLMAKGDYAQAQEAFADAAAMDPGNFEMHIMLGKLHVSQNQKVEAIKQFRAAVELRPDHLDAHYQLAELYSESPSTYKKAVEHAQKVLKAEPENAQARRLLAKVNTNLDNNSKAAELYEELLETGPENPEYLLQYSINLRQLRKYEQSLEILEKLAENNSGDNTVRIELGITHQAAGNHKRAVEVLNGIVKSMPWNVRARRSLARAYKSADMVDEAISQYKRILLIDPEDQESKDFLAKYNIQYMEGAFLDHFYDYPGKGEGVVIKKASAGPELPIAPYYMDDVDRAIIAHRMQIAEQMIIRNRLKRARYVYENLAEKYPDDPQIQNQLAEVYAATGMYKSAKKKYATVLQMQPNNQAAMCGLAKVKYDQSPSMEYYAGIDGAKRVEDLEQCVITGGGRFTFQFGDNSEVFGEVTVARHTEKDADDIDRLTPLIGLKLGLFGEIIVRGEYSYNNYSKLDPSHNYLAALQTNIYDVVGLEGYYYRDDIRKSHLAIEENIGKSNAGGVLRINPIGRLTLRGEYRHSQIDDSDLVDSNTSQLANGGVSYTFLNGPWFTTGYVYTGVMNESQQPQHVGAYWSPETYQNHAVTMEVMGQGGPVMYYAGAVPSYNMSDDKDLDDDFGFSIFSGLDWEAAISHRLGMDLVGSYGLADSMYEYRALLTYSYLFGSHSGIWRQ